MKVLVAYGAKDLRVEEREMPEPAQGQVRIKMAVGGICGSDLHYYNHGGFGSIRLKEPMILGHEVSGYVDKLGAGVTGLNIGDLVAVSPSRPCGTCDFCLKGLQNHCLNMRFYGSAMPYPHIQGAFRDFIVADVAQCAVAKGLSESETAMAEPLAVVLHAVSQAGDLSGKRVLVTGCGPIGLLAVLAARALGAAEVIATDITEFTLLMAARIGADRAINVREKSNPFMEFEVDKGQIDIMFECSGAASAVASAVPALRPRATIVQLGLGGDMSLPMQAMTAKEIAIKGSFRFHDEFFDAVQLMIDRKIKVRPLITHSLPLSEAVAAFDLAADRSKAVKVNIEF